MGIPLVGGNGSVTDHCSSGRPTIPPNHFHPPPFRGRRYPGHGPQLDPDPGRQRRHNRVHHRGVSTPGDGRLVTVGVAGRVFWGGRWWRCRDRLPPPAPRWACPALQSIAGNWNVARLRRPPVTTGTSHPIPPGNDWVPVRVGCVAAHGWRCWAYNLNNETPILTRCRQRCRLSSWRRDRERGCDR